MCRGTLNHSAFFKNLFLVIHFYHAGGSLAKLAYCSRIHRRMSQVLDRNEVGIACSFKLMFEWFTPHFKGGHTMRFVIRFTDLTLDSLILLTFDLNHNMWLVHLSQESKVWKLIKKSNCEFQLISIHCVGMNLPVQ